MKLERKIVEKPWGRTGIPPTFGADKKRQVGEICFKAGPSVTPGLLVKYLFTSEKLSVQVHPDNRQARKRGALNGKDECWYVLDAQPGAMIALGLTESAGPAKLRAAALLGEIEKKLDWKPVAAGDFYYVPAGTIHSIGPGLTLVEVQQNSDITYRLYDYGRDRELHLDDAIDVAKTEAYDMHNSGHFAADQNAEMFNGAYFRLWQAIGDDRTGWGKTPAPEWHVLPLAGEAMVRGEVITAGECGLATSAAQIDLSNSQRTLIVAREK